jgi:RNA polymerase sigma-70 factor (ECF subfamily)
VQRLAPRDLNEELVTLLPRLRRFARALARNVHDADDLVQLTIERALARADQLQRDAPVVNWMFGILRNAWIDELRTRTRNRRVFDSESAVEETGDPGQSDPAGLLSVQHALAQLPEEQRIAVALVLIEGLSYKEAAHVMDVPIGTLTSRLARGRETLQALLGEG